MYAFKIKKIQNTINHNLKRRGEKKMRHFFLKSDIGIYGSSLMYPPILSIRIY